MQLNIVKLICMPLVLVCACAVGCTMRGKLRERLRLLESICRLLRDMSSCVRSRLVPLGDMFDEIAETGDAPEFVCVCAQRLRDGDSFPEAWGFAVSCGRDTALLEEREQHRLEQLGGCLSMFSAEDELNVLEDARVFFTERVAAAADELRVKSRLYMSCSALAGIMIVIMLI